MKEAAAQHPEMPPANIIRQGMADVGEEVLPHLPQRPALKRTLNRKQAAELPQNPKTLSDIENLLERYQKSLSGEDFLLYDSRENDDSDDSSDGEEERPRAMVFATRNNLRHLGRSSVWFVDGTFSVAPLLFLQLFTIHGLFKGHAIPLVYALLTNKTEELYSLVLEKIQEKCQIFHINLPDPVTIISDFELAIINSCKRLFRHANMRLCFFHLGQALYRRVQGAGLQEAYIDPQDRTIKTSVHMILSLAFVPPEDVVNAFETLRRDLPRELLTIADDFENTYIRQRRIRTRRPGQNQPRYPIRDWSQYDATLSLGPRTNNMTEGWHNRFNAMVGKRHPTFYHLVRELQKEQRDTEVMIAELSLGRRVKVPKQRKYQQEDERLKSVAADYPLYKEVGRLLVATLHCKVQTNKPVSSW